MHKIFLKIFYFNSKFSEFFKYIAALLLVFIGIIIFLDIFLRKFLNKTIIGVPEMVANLVVIIAFLQLSYSIVIDGMLRSDFLSTKLPKKISLGLDALSSLLGSAFFFLLAYACYPSMIESYITSEFEGHTSFRFPTLPVKGVICIFSFLCFITYFLVLIKNILEIFKKK